MVSQSDGITRVHDAIIITPTGKNSISILSKQKIDQLTALRFFAAMLIVIHHCSGLFGFTETGFGLDHGVSFFFVLSGFILTYVYPSLDTWRERALFWRARLARVWPVYIASFILGALLLKWHFALNTTLVNLLMLQAWIPMSKYYFSYNAVGWSISTELFFYLMFPFIIVNISKNWPLKLCVSFIVILSTAIICDILLLKRYGDPYTGNDGTLITANGLMYIGPLSRIFEFIVGISIAVAWRNTARGQSTSITNLHTAIEIVAIGLCLASMYYIPGASGLLIQWGYTGTALNEWISHSGSVVAFAFLIYIMAIGKGWISNILSSTPLVFLGEISFSMYLIHQILLSYYINNIINVVNISNIFAFLTFVAVLITGSYLMWSCIEMPARKLLIGRHKIHGSAVTSGSWHAHIYRNKETVLAGLVMVCLVVYVKTEIKNAARPLDVAQTIRPASIPAELMPSRSCSLDLVDNANTSDGFTTIANAEVAMLIGWAIDEKAGNAPQTVFVQLSGGANAYVKAARTQRPDIADGFRNANLLNSGWSVSVDLSGLPPGAYEINLIQVEGTSATICHTGKSISVN
jgi:peptidoglycan/LPS O-acetylase OafA/YrhL